MSKVIRNFAIQGSQNHHLTPETSDNWLGLLAAIKCSQHEHELGAAISTARGYTQAMVDLGSIPDDKKRMLMASIYRVALLRVIELGLVSFELKAGASTAC